MFSVVIPLYNKRGTLLHTVSSVLSQRYRDFELIVVDDGSNDGSLSTLTDTGDPRLRILSQSNCGPGSARNTGVAASRSDWVAFLDADDLWLDDHLEELDAVRRAHPEAGLIGTSFTMARAHALPTHVPRRSGSIGLVRYFDAVGRGENVLHSSTAAVQKRAWRSVGGFAHLPSGEDSEFWVRLALCWPVAASSKVTALYLTGTGGISETQKTRWLGKPLRELGDLSPAAAVLVPEMARSGLNGSPARYIDRCLYWCLHGSARAGDVRTLRELRKLYRHSPLYPERIILATSAFPLPLAQATHIAIYALQAVWRRLGRLQRARSD